LPCHVRKPAHEDDDDDGDDGDLTRGAATSTLAAKPKNNPVSRKKPSLSGLGKAKQMISDIVIAATQHLDLAQLGATKTTAADVLADIAAVIP
jgi:hypothetical protein